MSVRRSPIVKVRRKQPFLLLEVLVAFFLVALCALPLMQPQFAMLKAERAFINSVTLDRVVNHLYTDLLLRFYRGEIAWSSIGTLKTPLPPIPIIDPEVAALGFKGSYRLRLRPYTGKRGDHSKGGQNEPFIPHNRHLVEVQYNFTINNEEPLIYTFWLYVQTVTEVSRASTTQ